jgi:RimJ/RimL family protein N-acetyltransferase
MSYVTTTAAHIPSVGKVMLTCFTSNARGRRFYEKLGFAVDENASPRERRLRGGKVIKPDYVIMSRTEKGEADGSVVVAVDSGLEGR